MMSASEARPAAPAASAQIFGCVVVSKQGRTLLSCSVGQYAQSPALRPAGLGNLLATLQDLGGSPSSAVLELGGIAITLFEEQRVILGILCAPASASQARLLGRQLIHAFISRFAELIPVMEAEHAQKIGMMLSTYTCDSAARQSDETNDSMTLAAFQSFQKHVVQPLLLRPTLTPALLTPMLRTFAHSLCMFVVEPKPQSIAVMATHQKKAIGRIHALSKEVSILIASESTSSTASLCRWAGPHSPPIWSAVSEQVFRSCSRQPDHSSVVTGGHRAHGRAEAEITPIVVDADAHQRISSGLVFPTVTDPHDTAMCLHSAITSLAMPPEGACVLAFYWSERTQALTHIGSCNDVDVRRQRGSLKAPPTLQSPADAYAHSCNVPRVLEASDGPFCCVLGENALSAELCSAMRSVARSVEECFVLNREEGLRVPESVCSNTANWNARGDRIQERIPVGQASCSTVGKAESTSAQSARAEATCIDKRPYDDASSDLTTPDSHRGGDNRRLQATSAISVGIRRSLPFELVIESPRQSSVASVEGQVITTKPSELLVEEARRDLGKDLKDAQ